MRFSKEELKNIIIVLEESDILAENEDRAAQKMSQWLAAVVDDSDCDECYDLINKDHYVATTFARRMRMQILCMQILSRKPWKIILLDGSIFMRPSTDWEK